MQNFNTLCQMLLMLFWFHSCTLPKCFYFFGDSLESLKLDWYDVFFSFMIIIQVVSLMLMSIKWIRTPLDNDVSMKISWLFVTQKMHWGDNVSKMYVRKEKGRIRMKLFWSVLTFVAVSSRWCGSYWPWLCEGKKGVWACPGSIPLWAGGSRCPWSYIPEGSVPGCRADISSGWLLKATTHKTTGTSTLGTIFPDWCWSWIFKENGSISSPETD